MTVDLRHDARPGESPVPSRLTDPSAFRACSCISIPVNSAVRQPSKRPTPQRPAPTIPGLIDTEKKSHVGKGAPGADRPYPGAGRLPRRTSGWLIPAACINATNSPGMQPDDRPEDSSPVPEGLRGNRPHRAWYAFRGPSTGKKEVRISPHAQSGKGEVSPRRMYALSGHRPGPSSSSSSSPVYRRLFIATRMKARTESRAATKKRIS